MPIVDVHGAVPTVFEPVLARLTADAQEHFGVPRAQLLPLTYEDRRFSHLLRVGVCQEGCERPDSHVFVKIYKPKPIEDGVEKMRVRVEQDFQVTKGIYRSMSGWTELGAVRPIACYAEHLAIVTEQAEGDTLLAHLKAHASWFPGAATCSQLAQTMTAVGQWLRAFQSIDRPTGRISVSDLRAYVDVRLDRLQQEAGLTPSERQRMLGHLDRLGALVPASDLMEVNVHADLAPGNILVSGRRVVVLDFGVGHRGSYLHDISRLFLQLDLLRAKPQFWRSVIRPLQLALLSGLDPSLSPEQPLFRFLLMLHRVNHLATLSVNHERFPASVYNGHIRRLHRRWIEQQMETTVVGSKR